MNLRSCFSKKLGLIILLAGLIRCFQIQEPIYETSATRQEMTASMARNYVQYNYPFLKPTLDFPGPRYQIYQEMPVYQYVVARVYRLVGQIDVAWARGVSVACGLIVILAGYGLARLAFRREQQALWVAGILAFAPFLVTYTRTVQPDALMFASSMVALWAAYAWSKNPRWFIFLAACLAAGVSFVTKPPSLFIAGPILFLIWDKQRWSALRKKELVLFMGIALGPLLAWMLFAHKQHQLNPLANGWGTVTLGHLFQLELFLKTKIWNNMFQYLVFKSMTPLIFIWAIRAMWKKPRLESFFYVWLSAVLVFMVAFAANTEGHKYYYVPLIMVLAFFAGHELGQPNWGLVKPLAQKWRLVIVALSALLGLGLLKSTFFVKGEYKHAIEAQTALRDISQPEDLIISSRRLYYTERAGWIQVLGAEQDADEIIKNIQEYQQQGAKYFLITHLGHLESHPELVAYFNQHHEQVLGTDKYRIYRLCQR